MGRAQTVSKKFVGETGHDDLLLYIVYRRRALGDGGKTITRAGRRGGGGRSSIC